MTDVKPGTYRHWSGSYYTVIGVAKHMESGKEFVIYHREGLQLPEMYARDVDMFTGTIKINDIVVPRFEFQYGL